MNLSMENEKLDLINEIIKLGNEISGEDNWTKKIIITTGMKEWMDDHKKLDTSELKIIKEDYLQYLNTKLDK